ncbi:MAG: nuclear transport factor 2 family protein [Halomonadaceae bacterium]|jgi:ketosteroid isomerase-like protein|uniref:nuclear transport factor 2 family protein n=1 Tax=Halomonas sp. MCCC 1A11062 TaxID=2733485 RepID=UPI001F23017B|nr:nuclear transport factor 2 family protein [Halomonas sp. MCCC 1A11062]MCE8037463.1 nuclear transport factor 2 family protein [Halomonas sp. MCCC 1A11062]
MPANKPAAAPEEVVRDFLAAMEARELERAGALLDEEFSMVFPGSGEMHRLEELVAWAADRYRFVRKRIAAVETCDGNGVTAVFCHGELDGEWPDGTPFAGVRFIDRFELRHGRIVRQQVWNDLALARR